MEFCIYLSECFPSEIVNSYWLLVMSSINNDKKVIGKMMIIIWHPIGLCKLRHLIWNKACELDIVISVL